MNALHDPFGRAHTYLRVSVTDRCNLRCAYCMPPEGVAMKERDEILRFDEILRVVRVLADHGVHKVRVTGGEPLVRRGLERLVATLAAVPGIRTVGMTTNGVLLAAAARSLRDSGLTHLNVSLDSLHPQRFARITLRDQHQRVLDGIEAALAAGFAPLKINMVVMGGVNDDELLDFVALARDKPVCVRFIEYMPFGPRHWTKAHFVPYKDMLARIGERHTLTPLHDSGDGVAREFGVAGHRGMIGFITAMSEHFCDSCNRLRLTADGQLKTCLFTPAEANLRDVLRSGANDETLAAAVAAALRLKPRQHPPMQELAGLAQRSMVEIGG